jgi:hypothetical protein
MASVLQRLVQHARDAGAAREARIEPLLAPRYGQTQRAASDEDNGVDYGAPPDIERDPLPAHSDKPAPSNPTLRPPARATLVDVAASTASADTSSQTRAATDAYSLRPPVDDAPAPDRTAPRQADSRRLERAAHDAVVMPLAGSIDSAGLAPLPRAFPDLPEPQFEAAARTRADYAQTPPALRVEQIMHNVSDAPTGASRPAPRAPSEADAPAPPLGRRRQAADTTGMEPPTIASPDIRISIGRVELHADAVQPAQQRQRGGFRPRVTLGEFLDRRSGGKR